MLSFLIFATTCRAEDPAAPVDAAQQQVVCIQEQLNEQVDRLTAIERFLADDILVKEGKAPKGWVQPPIDDYMKPGTPVSMIPVPPKPPTVSARVPYGPQP